MPRQNRNASARPITRKEQERFRRRKVNFWKKAYELSAGCGADIYIVIRRNERYHTYNSSNESSWLPSQQDLDNFWPPPERKGPWNFETHDTVSVASDHEPLHGKHLAQSSPPQSGLNSSPFPNSKSPQSSEHQRLLQRPKTVIEPQDNVNSSKWALQISRLLAPPKLPASSFQIGSE